MAERRENQNATEIRNKKASHDYLIFETFEAGIVLHGTEVKSVKLGHAQINEAFVRLDRKGLPVLFNAQIDEYTFGTCANHETKQQRRLLLHQREIRKLQEATEREGYTAIPLKMYVKHGLVKLLFGLCKGKKNYDKRHDLRERTEMREAQRYLSNRERRHG